MYRCNECNCKFETPKRISIEEFYGVDSDIKTTQKIDICPNCESNDIEEQMDIFDILERN